MRLRECLGLVDTDVPVVDVGSNEKHRPLKQEKHQTASFRSFNNESAGHQLVSNSSTQVKDEEIYATMNAMCQIFDDTLDASATELQTNREDSEVNLDHHRLSEIVATEFMTSTSCLSQDLTEDVASGQVDDQYLSICDSNEPMPSIQPVSTTIHPPEEPAITTSPKKIVPLRSHTKRSSKVLKSKADLDKCLEESRQRKRTRNRSTTKKAKRLLKIPDRCFDCGKTFPYHGYLEAHMRTHTGERPFHCHLCSLQFAQAGNLALHLRVHTGERPYQCELCSKLFTTSSNLKAHQRIHSSVKDHKCTQCDRAFRSLAELVSHAGTHSGRKDHVCKLCGKAFYKTSYLNVHFRTVHVGEKRHRCSECGKEFSNSSNLTCHFR